MRFTTKQQILLFLKYLHNFSGRDSGSSSIFMLISHFWVTKKSFYFQQGAEPLLQGVDGWKGVISKKTQGAETILKKGAKIIWKLIKLGDLQKSAQFEIQ